MGHHDQEIFKEMEHRLAIAIESMDAKLGLLAEGMLAMEERLERKMDGFHAELKEEIRLTQNTIRIVHDKLDAKIEEVKIDLQGVKEELQETKEEVKEVAVQTRENRAGIGRLERRFDHFDRRLATAEEHIPEFREDR